jgi:hypothetical protein
MRQALKLFLMLRNRRGLASQVVTVFLDWGSVASAVTVTDDWGSVASTVAVTQDWMN